MTTLVAHPRSAALQPPDGDPAGGDATLTMGQLVDRAWEGLHRAGGVTGTTECPVCRGTMRLGATAGAARCDGCGSKLW